jgi:hypothetical protein
MAFTLEHVQQVRNGRPQQVGVLPVVVWQKLSWPCPWVYLGQSGLKHIAEKHPDVTDFDLLWLPLAIDTGMIVQLAKSPRQILVVHKAEPTRFYLCALKAARGGTEIWVDSFYRIKEGRFDTFARKGPILRPHK